MPTLEQILETDEYEGSEIETEEQVEDHITASVAEELLGEGMVSPEEGVVQEESEVDQDVGFVEMVEGLGFDRRTALSDRKGKGVPPDTTQGLKRKRFLESGHWFYRQGLYLKAAEAFQKAIEEDPEFVETYQCLGDALFRLGQLDKAREAYEKVRRLDPTNVNVLENLGVIFANRGDYKRAVWQWGEVLKRNPERKDIIDRIKKMQRVIRQRYL